MELEKIMPSEVMKINKDTHGMYLLQSVEPKKLGKEEESRGRDTWVTWIYGARVYSKCIKVWLGMEMMLGMAGDIEWVKKLQEANPGTERPLWVWNGNALRGNFLKSLKEIQIWTPSNGEYKVLAHFLSWQDFQW